MRLTLPGKARKRLSARVSAVSPLMPNSHSLLVSTTLSPSTNPQSAHTYRRLEPVNQKGHRKSNDVRPLLAHQIPISGLFDDIGRIDFAVLTNQPHVQVLSERLLRRFRTSNAYG
jgi:hypothetical protein